MDINYDDILLTLYLSQLIYDYHKNESFNLQPYETILSFISNIDIDSDSFIYIKEPLLHISNNYQTMHMYDFISNKQTDTQVGIFIDDCNRNIYVVFRGTESLQDCWNDINVIKEDIYNCNIHAGFYKQVKSVYDDIIYKIGPYIELFKYNVFITGHSLGGADATVFAFLLNNEYNDIIIKLITFGSPRVGDLKWKNTFDSINNIINLRITNNRDIVTVIPLIGYHHVGKQILLTKDSLTKIHDSKINYYYTRSLIHSFSVDDHKINNYCKNFIDKNLFCDNYKNNNNNNYNKKSKDICC